MKYTSGIGALNVAMSWAEASTPWQRRGDAGRQRLARWVRGGVIVLVRVHDAVDLITALSIGLAAPAVAACHPHLQQPVNYQQRRYMFDVEQHGGLTAAQVLNTETRQTLGDVVCAELHKGDAAGNEVVRVAGGASELHGSMPKAEVAVYWAITDLCPDQISQRQDRWRDGQ